MTTTVFDTLKASRDLKAAGFDETQAEAIVITMAEAFDDTVATKANLDAVKAELKQDIAAIKGDMKLLKWMVGVVLACVAFPLLKSFCSSVETIRQRTASPERFR